MKRLPVLLLLLFSAGKATPQTNAGVFRLDSIPEKGTILNTGWVFKAGDNPLWAAPDYNDGDWAAVDATDEIHHLPIVRDAGMGWFRIKIQAGPLVRGKTFAMLTSGFGAMEIFLNGKLIYDFGKPDSAYPKEVTRFFSNNLLSLTLDTAAMQVIAVRYSFHKKNLYVKFANKRPILKIELKEINHGITDVIKKSGFESTLRTVQVSFYLPLGFLLLFLFMSFRPQKEYLYAGIFCLSLFLAILFHILALTEPVRVNHSNSFLLATQVLYIIGAISFIHSMYVLYKLKKGWLFWLIVTYGVFSIPYYFISYDKSGIVNAFFFPVINLEFLRLNIIAVSRKRKGAVILLTTSIVFALTIISYIWCAINQDNNGSALFQGISFIIPGLGLSIFYAGEFARTASSLRQRAVQVETLSQEMIAKEKEKQQILSEQNETLEKQVTERTAALNRSLEELKATEAQLIQSEKIATVRAKQAEVEAALEGVRARAMAMQKSYELSDLVKVLYEKLNELGITSDGININIVDRATKNFDSWISAPGLNTAICFHVPYFKNPVTDDIYAALDGGKDLMTKEYSYDDKSSFFTHLYQHTGFKMLPEERKKLVLAAKKWEVSIAFAGNIGLSLHSYSGKIFSDAENEILKRFAKVFEQTYTRFLDLQKAEAQGLRAEQDLVEIKAAREKAEETLIQLQATQKQLIQSEKMASLGELTAGIAHEIQNPLNFVNNFSEVNTELLDEMKDELAKGHSDHALRIADDVRQNNEKINHHGKRADSIVKGMLQHSRGNKGQKELTDISQLVDECMRLSFHGLRAKNKSFNAKTETDFEPGLPKIRIVSQDVGRVVLNMFTNAFYSVLQKAKQADNGFEPMVRAKTFKLGNKIVISIRDNGNGIPQSVIDKIYQPFFTTKPAGEGTGLGLSICYEIITNGHGGELKVETKENEFAEFSILLPVEENEPTS